MTAETMTKEDDYIRRVEELSTGQLAMLRRGCGERDPVSGRCPWLLEYIHGASTEPVAFLVASLLAQYKTTDIRARSHRINGDFGKTWKKAIAGNDSESIRRRFHILLDAEFDPYTGGGDLPHRLRQMVRYAANKGIGVDWPVLMKHLSHWNSAKNRKWVQKAWARSFYINEQEEGGDGSAEGKE